VKIEYIKGDLLASPEPLIVHGCNAKGAYASGFAGAVRKKHAFAYDAYMETYKEIGLKLGTINWAEDDNLIIGNAITQANYGRDGKLYVSYDAIRSVMRIINAAATEGIPYGRCRHGYDRVAMPKIGSSLAGGDWSVIAAIIEEELTSVTPVVYVLD
jgi:O-acetyl-ADP-ribose deacetylase (regulator of RNase III)